MRLFIKCPICLIRLAILAGLALAASCSATTPEVGVQYQDDFSDVSSGWDRVQAAEGSADYKDGGYQISVNQPQVDIWANPRADLKFHDNVRIEVDAQKIDGADNNNFGVLCRFQDDRNFYFFAISSDGYYGIGKVKDGQQSLINRAEMLPNEKIGQGDKLNHLRADCVGSTLTLYVNGELIDTQQDADFSSGTVGLLAGTFDTAGAVIHFDNFRVTKP